MVLLFSQNCIVPCALLSVLALTWASGISRHLYHSDKSISAVLKVCWLPLDDVCIDKS